MPFAALVLILIFALVHSTWSLIAKKAPKSPAFYAATIFTGVLLYMPFCVPTIRANPRLFSVWPFFAISGLFLACYYTLMGKTYRRADLSVAYPLLRLGPIFITVWSILFLNENVTPTALMGILLVVIGAIILPQESLRFSRGSFNVKRYLNLTYGMALTAAFCTSIYVVVDKYSMSLINKGGDWRVAFSYVWMEMAICSVLLLVFSLFDNPKETWGQVRRAKLKVGSIAPLLIGAYVLVMTAMSLDGAKASYIGAFRQLSVMFTVFGGVMILRESFGRVRIVSSLVILAGLAMIILSKGPPAVG